HTIPLLFGKIRDGSHSDNSRIVDQYVDTGELLDCFGRHSLAVRKACNVGEYRHSLYAATLNFFDGAEQIGLRCEVIGERLIGGIGKVDACDIGAGLCEFECYATADAAR